MVLDPSYLLRGVWTGSPRNLQPHRVIVAPGYLSLTFTRTGTIASDSTFKISGVGKDANDLEFLGTATATQASGDYLSTGPGIRGKFACKHRRRTSVERSCSGSGPRYESHRGCLVRPPATPDAPRRAIGKRTLAADCLWPVTSIPKVA